MNPTINPTTLKKLSTLEELAASFPKLKLPSQLPISDKEKMEKLIAYQHLLHEENSRFNLIGTRDWQVIFTKHLCDSLLPLNHFPTPATIADLGSGGGLPGIPLAIYLPENSFYLIEAKRKKADFLHKMKATLALDNLEVINENISEVKKKFAFFTARGLGSMPKIIQLTRRIALYPVTYLLYKGKREVIEQEIREMKNRKPLPLRWEIIPLPHSLFPGVRHLVKINVPLYPKLCRK